MQNQLLVGVLKNEGERRLGGEMETTSYVNEKENGNGKPGTHQGGKVEGATGQRDRVMETEALNGKDEEEGGEGEEER